MKIMSIFSILIRNENQINKLHLPNRQNRAYMKMGTSSSQLNKSKTEAVPCHQNTGYK